MGKIALIFIAVLTAYLLTLIPNVKVEPTATVVINSAPRVVESTPTVAMPPVEALATGYPEPPTQIPLGTGYVAPGPQITTATPVIAPTELPTNTMVPKVP